jgi:hypothetical protein
MRLLFKKPIGVFTASTLVVFYVVLSIYVLIPGPKFPDQIPGSLKSVEPADTETVLRQGFYTDWDREQIIAFYRSQFSTSSLADIPLATVRLNYPPEDAQTLIRDQTHSRYLEELVHPLRESIFISGFFAKIDSERMFFGPREYKTKVIIRVVPSNPLVRWFFLTIDYIVLVVAILVVIKNVRLLWSFIRRNNSERVKKE